MIKLEIFCSGNELEDPSLIANNAVKSTKLRITLKCRAEGLGFKTAEAARSVVRRRRSRASKLGDGWTNAALSGNPCGSDEAKNQVDSVKKGNLKQGEVPTRAMALSHQRTEKLAQALNFGATASSATVPFVLATASAALCLWLRASETLSLRLNQVTQNEKGECQVSCYEATLRECENARSTAEAQARKACSRDHEPDTGTRKHYAKWVPTHEQAIGRRLQDDDRAFPHVEENGNVNPKVSVSKDKHEKWFSRWIEKTGAVATTLGSKRFSHYNALEDEGLNVSSRLRNFASALINYGLYEFAFFS